MPSIWLIFRGNHKDLGNFLLFRRFWLWAVPAFLLLLFLLDTLWSYEGLNSSASRRMNISFYDEQDQFYSQRLVPWQAVELLPDKLSFKQSHLAQGRIRARFARSHKAFWEQWLNGMAGWAAAYYLASLASAPNKATVYYLERARLYRDAFVLSLVHSPTELMRALFQRIPCDVPVQGFAGMVRLLYDKSLSALALPEHKDQWQTALSFAMDQCFGRVSGLDGEHRKRLRRRIARQLLLHRPQSDNKRHFMATAMAMLRKRDYTLSAQSAIELHIYTTLEAKAQRQLAAKTTQYFVPKGGKSKEVSEKMEPVYARLRDIPSVQAAAAVYAKDGAILAAIGGVPGKSGFGYNRYYLSHRPISSTVKPFLYTLAMDACDYHPATRLVDKEIELQDQHGKIWRPQNHYHDYIGPVTFKQALVESINTIAVQLIQCIGVERFAAKLLELFAMPGNKIHERFAPSLSLSLGSLDLTPHELGQGYLTLMNLGRKTEPYAIRRVENGRQEVVYQRDLSQKGRQIFPAKFVASVRDMMRSVVQHGTASRYGQDAFSFQVAGKTGSSPSDSWFVGFHPERLFVAWAGYDEPSMSRIKELPLFTVVPFWVAVMKRLTPAQGEFDLPDGLQRKEFCRYMGCRGSAECAPIMGLFAREVSLPRCREDGQGKGP